MTSREELQKILAAQRLRRKAIPPSAPQKLSVSRGNIFVNMMIVTALIGFGFLTWMIFALPAPQNSKAGAKYPATLAPGAIEDVIAATSTQDISITRQVCTNIPNGRLHVRFDPGNGSEVRGYLAEAEKVQVSLLDGSLEAQTVHGEVWLRLQAPVSGWVNASFLCEARP